MNILLSSMLWTSYFISLYFAVFFIITFFENKHLFERKERIKLRKHPGFTVVIPAYNEENTIIPTIKSVLNLNYPKELLDIIIIDDGSKDNTKSVVEEFIKGKNNVKLISHENRGKGRSLNIALNHIKTEFFACLDADSEVDKNALKRMLSFYYSDSESVAIITPALKVKNANTLIEKMQRVEYLAMILAAKITSILDCQYVAPGPFSIYKTEVIRKLGGFDEHSLTEDQEIAYRVQSMHYKIIHCKDAYVFTRTPQSLKAFYKQRNRWYKGSLLTLHKYKGIVLNKNYGDFGFFQLLKNTLAIYLSVTALIFAGRWIVWPLFRKLKEFYSVDFDFMPYADDFSLSVDFLGFDLRVFIIMSALITISLILFYYSHKYTRERIFEKGFVSLIPYVFVYYIIKAGIFFIVLVELAVKKRQKW